MTVVFLLSTLPFSASNKAVISCLLPRSIPVCERKHREPPSASFWKVYLILTGTNLWTFELNFLTFYFYSSVTCKFLLQCLCVLLESGAKLGGGHSHQTVALIAARMKPGL